MVNHTQTILLQIVSVSFFLFAASSFGDVSEGEFITRAL